MKYFFKVQEWVRQTSSPEKEFIIIFYGIQWIIERQAFQKTTR